MKRQTTYTGKTWYEEHAKPYCKPLNAGLASELRAVGQRIGKLLDALADQITPWVAEGELLAEIQQLRHTMLDRLDAEGWRISVNARDRYQVLPPKRTQ